MTDNTREWEDQFNSLWKSTSAWNLHPHDSQPVIEFIHQQLQKDRHSLHTSLVAAVEGLPHSQAVLNPNPLSLGDAMISKNRVLTIINSIFKE